MSQAALPHEMLEHVPEEVLGGIEDTIPSDGWAAPMRSRVSSTSSSQISRRSSPGRCGPSTAEWTRE